MSKSKPLIVGETAVERHHITYVEAELREYPARKQRLSYIETCIATATPDFEPGMPRGSETSNPTFGRALSLMRDQERNHLQGWLRIVEDIYLALPDMEQTIIRQLYWERQLTIDGVAALLHVDRATIYRRRNPVLLQYAITMIGPHVATNVRQKRGA